MKPQHFQLMIPVAPDSINDVVSFGSQYSDLRSMKKKWQELAAFNIRQAIQNGELPNFFTGLVGFHFKLYFKTERLRDTDNYYLMCKGIIDAFVESGMIEDDNYKHAEFNGIRVAVDRDCPKVVIYLKHKRTENDGVMIENYESNNYIPRQCNGGATDDLVADQDSGIYDDTESSPSEPSGDLGNVGDNEGSVRVLETPASDLGTQDETQQAIL